MKTVSLMKLKTIMAIIAKAKRYFTRLVNLAGKGDSRPEIDQAKAYLAKNYSNIPREWTAK